MNGWKASEGDFWFSRGFQAGFHRDSTGNYIIFGAQKNRPQGNISFPAACLNFLLAARKSEDFRALGAVFCLGFILGFRSSSLRLLCAGARCGRLVPLSVFALVVSFVLARFALLGFS